MSKLQAQTQLEKNRDFVKKNRGTLLKQYPNKYILVVDGKVVDSFHTYEDAADKGVEAYGIDGRFYIEFISEEEPINYAFTALI